MGSSKANILILEILVLVKLQGRPGSVNSDCLLITHNQLIFGPLHTYLAIFVKLLPLHPSEGLPFRLSLPCFSTGD
jgi:hypothetical protein